MFNVTLLERIKMMGDKPKQEILFWAKFVAVLVGGYGMYRGYGPVTAVCGLYAAWHIARLHKIVAAHTEQLKDKRRLP